MAAIADTTFLHSHDDMVMQLMLIYKEILKIFISEEEWMDLTYICGKFIILFTIHFHKAPYFVGIFRGLLFLQHVV